MELYSQVSGHIFASLFFLNSSIFQRLDAFFVRSQGSAKSKKNEKTQGFLGKNQAIFYKNFQNFVNQYKPPKYTSSPNFGLFEAFLAKKVQIFVHFWAQFFPINL